MSVPSVLITGINGGIGNALAKVFTDHGYTVYGTDKGEQNCIASEYIECDLAEYVANENYRIERTEKFHSTIKELDVLINNAAYQYISEFSKISLKEWNTSMNVNFSAPFLLSQVFLEKLKKSAGCIINIGSIHSELTKKGFVAYASSKSGLVGLTKAMALELGHLLRVNAINPAAISTEMLREGFKDNDKAYEALKAYHPTHDIGSPEDVARLALFLADKKNSFINGSVVKIDGGISSALHDPI